MKITALALFGTLAVAFAADDVANDASAAIDAAADDQNERRLDCWNGPAERKWHPQYQLGWTEGYCRNTRDCDSPGYDTELACCKGSYLNQASGKCLASLPEPPTQSPTGSGGLDVWYPDYDTAWSDAHCINERPMPSGRPTYDSMLACCKGAYGGQVSGKCLAELPFPPTQSPTGSGGLDVYYPKPGVAWTEGYCINERPFPNNVGQGFDTQEECCNTAYGSQASNDCMCKVDPCYSCNCGSLSQLGNGGCLEGADGQSGANGDLDCGQNDSD